jgi:hypothetical protein
MPGSSRSGGNHDSKCALLPAHGTPSTAVAMQRYAAPWSIVGNQAPGYGCQQARTDLNIVSK